MDFAVRVSEMSYAEKLKVGAVIVNNDTCVFGYNGSPAGWSNVCENKIYFDPTFDLPPDTKLTDVITEYPLEDETGRYYLKTKPEVLHAESNALVKLARSTIKAEDAIMFITHGPCIHCAKMIYQVGINEVYYLNEYRSTDGIEFLKQCKINIQQFQ